MGRGAPDYYGSLHRAATYALFNLKSTETRVNLSRTMTSLTSLFSHVKPVLASGATAHLVDLATGSDTPYTIPAEYEFTWIMTWYSIDQPARVLAYIDTQLYAELYPDPLSTWYANFVVPFQVSMIDPTFASAHLFDITLTNIGGEDLRGTAVVTGILESKSTPPRPKVKTVYCKHCGASAVIPVDTHKRLCLRCGGETWYYARKVI